MKLKYTIVILLTLTLIFVSIDIFAGIWYWNRNNLVFNSIKFNNISTPILTIVSVIIYAWALLTTTNQNKIILSQNIKPFYEREIEKLYKKAKKIRLEDTSLYTEKINALNYIKYIHKTFMLLTQNKEYNEDYDISFSDKNFGENYFTNKSYIREILFLTQFIYPINSISFFYGDLKKIIEEINTSKLIEEDKILLKKQIQRTFLLEYMELITQMKKHSFYPKMPIIYAYPPSDNIDFKLLSDTDFAKYYNYFKQQF